MKMVKNIAIVACAASFMFANVSFHMGNNYSTLDEADVSVPALSLYVLPQVTLTPANITVDKVTTIAIKVAFFIRFSPYLFLFISQRYIISVKNLFPFL